MLILPLKFIREEDKKTVGINLYNLAKLGHLGLPVIESVIVIPSVSIFENAVNKFLKNHPNLKNNLMDIKSEILKLPVPESLKNFGINNKPSKTKLAVDIGKLWENLLEKWSFEIISKIQRDEKNTYHLTPQLVVFSANFSAFGKGYFDGERNHAVIKVEQGKIDFQISGEIENLIISGNKKLLLPQVYYWGIEDGETSTPGGIKIVKVAPFTQNMDEEMPRGEKIGPIQKNEVKNFVKTATKILLDLRTEELISYNFDGAILNISKLDEEKISQNINKIQKFDPHPKIIFNPDLELSYGETLEFAKVFLFYRNKKKLDVQIVLPETFSVGEFLDLKREFASLGIYSKGSLKIWKQFNTAADFINNEDYIDGGFDGALIDLDKIARIVCGLDGEEVYKDARSDRLFAIEKFFKEMGLSKIIKEQKQVLIKGKLVSNEQLLSYFIKSGVWGVAFENSGEDLREYIGLLEKQTVKKIIPG